MTVVVFYKLYRMGRHLRQMQEILLQVNVSTKRLEGLDREQTRRIAWHH